MHEGARPHRESIAICVRRRSGPTMHSVIRTVRLQGTFMQSAVRRATTRWDCKIAPSHARPQSTVPRQAWSLSHTLSNDRDQLSRPPVAFTRCLAVFWHARAHTQTHIIYGGDLVS